MVCRLVAILALGHDRLLRGKLGQLREPPQHIHHVRIGKHGGTLLQEIAQVVDGWGDGLQEMGLPLEISAEAVGAKHLQRAEEDKQ